jgi:LacI family transcriptional regulator
MDNIPKVSLTIETVLEAARDTVRGITKYANIHGPWVFNTSCPFWTLGRKKNAWLEYVKQSKPDAIVMHEIENMGQLRQLDIPKIVLCQKKPFYEGAANLIGQHDKIGSIAAKHLLDKGYRSFAFYGFKGFYFSDERCKSFSAWLAHKGYGVDVLKEKHYNKPYTWGLWLDQAPALCKWLNSLEKPVGIMTANDERGREILEACKIAKLDIPDDVGVIGCGNDDYLCNLLPSLSSIIMGTFRAGYDAAAMLDKLMKGKHISDETIVVKTGHVIARHSTDIRLIEDKTVSKAISFIRHNNRRIIQIEDVISYAGTSRRSLQLKFKQVMGRNIHEEIVQSRIAYISKLLRETNIPVSEIALHFGYYDNKNFARLFKQRMNVTPSQYRMKYQKQ